MRIDRIIGGAIALISGIIVGVALVTAIRAVFAENQISTKRASFHPARGSVGSIEKGHLRTVQNGSDVNWTCWADGDGEGEIIPWESLVTWHCPSPGGIVCLSMTINGTDITLNTTTGIITDAATTRGFTSGAAPDGAGTCFFCNGYFAQQLSKAIFADTTNVVLYRDGVCTDPAGAPCRADSECDTAATCTVSGNAYTSGAITGAYTCWADGVVSYVTAE